MRGKDDKFEDYAKDERITPAHAGKSGGSCSQSVCVGDHPRPCGEKSAPSDSSSTVQGSPPPMRRKAREKWGGLDFAGITPAHAGKRRGGRARIA